MIFGIGQTELSFSSDGVVEFGSVTADDIRATMATSASAQLDPDTPGGAAVRAWADSGYSMNRDSVAKALAAGMGKSKNRVVREAGQTSIAMASTMYAGCTASGVGAAVAPLCGAMGAFVGAIAGVFTAHAGARHEAAVALRDAWWGANLALASGILAIKNAYYYVGGTITDEEAACLLVDSMKALGSKRTDRIWGMYKTSSRCGIPGRICSNARNTLRYAQGHYPWPALPEGEEYPDYFIMEKWWMLKKDKYGNCVNKGDIKPDACWQDKKSTRYDRARGMRDLADMIVSATEVAIATMVNLKDQRSRELAQAYYRSEQYKQDTASAASAATSIQRSYGEFMKESADGLRKYCGMEDLSDLLSQGSEVFYPVLQECQMDQLLASGYSPGEAMIHVNSKSVDEALRRAQTIQDRKRVRVAQTVLAVVAVGLVGTIGYLVYREKSL